MISTILKAKYKALFWSLVALFYFLSYNSSFSTDCDAIDCILIDGERKSPIYHTSDTDLYLDITESGAFKRKTASTSSSVIGILINGGSESVKKNVTIDNYGLMDVDGIVAVSVDSDAIFTINNYGIVSGKYITTYTGAASLTQFNITNNNGEMSGRILLGDNGDSSFILNDGTINGILHAGSQEGETSQLVELNGGVFNGNIELVTANAVIDIGESDFNGEVKSYDDDIVGGVVNITASRSLDEGMSLGASNLFLDEVSITNSSDVTYDGSYFNTAAINIENGSSLSLARSMNNDLELNALGGSKLALSNKSHKVKNLLMESDSELAISILVEDDVATYPTMTITESAILEKGVKMNITTTSGNYTYIPDGGSFLIIDAGSGSDINEIKHVDDDHGILDFITRVENKSGGGQSLYVDVIRPSVVDVTKDPNQQNVLRAIQVAGNDSVGELRSMLQYLDYSASGSTIESVLQTLEPNDYNYVQQNSITTINEKISINENRMDKMHLAYFNRKRKREGGGYALTQRVELADNSADISKYLAPFLTKDEMRESSIANWVQVFGTKAKQKNINNNGYHSDSYGVAFGFDAELDKNVRGGISFGHNKSSIKSSDRLRATNTDSYLVNLYVGKSYDKYFMDAVLGFAWNKYSSYRTIDSQNITAESNYSGQNYVSKVRGGVVFDKINDSNWNLMPEVSATFVNSRVDSYTEQNAGNLGLQVRDNSNEYLEGRIGLNVNHTPIKTKLFTKRRDFLLAPKLHISYGYNFLNKKQTTVANFIGQGTTFNNVSSGVGSASLKSGVSLDIYDMDAVTVSVNYVDERRSNYMSQSASVKFRYGF